MYLLRVSEPKDLSRVCAFLANVHVLAHVHDDGTVTVSIPGAPTALHERREITGYVATWNALNPSHLVELVDLP